MKINELISILQKCDQEKEVYSAHGLIEHIVERKFNSEKGTYIMLYDQEGYDYDNDGSFKVFREII